ncbi:uncharacterized protein LOC132719590 [Ruditapes philippinarum]|uniref:uncharacterized protein LOC132719590 n=1 Tax=Ruditapes philippinarum TaxID=129788 RepID=UPI00295BE501|nr:uncharacterized protein LOC132719590 [Ruditapes philippinarum]
MNDDELPMRKFKSTLTFQDGRYSVTWPWKEENPDLPENKGLELDDLSRLKHDIYVDNIITGASSDEQAVDLYKEAKSMFKDASMNLREWSSSSEKVNSLIPEVDRSTETETKVLGHVWGIKSDILSVKSAYATAIYLQQENATDVKSNLIFAKTRLAPVKAMTIPRLEVMAVLIGVRCLKFVKTQLMIEISQEYLWTDSQVALDCINIKKQLPVFVKNRVKEIKNNNCSIIAHVDTKNNPADIATRAIVLKFIRKLKNLKDDAKYLTCDGLREAENLWIVNVQKNIYNKDYKNIQKKKPSGLQRQLRLVIDNNGLLRCTGRLGNFCLSEGERQPILLPHKEEFTELVIQRAHKECMHYGISHTLSRTKQTYWITRGRSAVKAALNKCNVCRRYDGGPYKMPVMAALSSSRVQKSSAFSRTGLDYLGHLNIKTSNGNRKVWMCLFSCMTTRAIHLEVIQDLNTEEFLMCLQRFISQRNTPIEIASDNAAQFKLASKVINHI